MGVLAWSFRLGRDRDSGIGCRQWQASVLYSYLAPRIRSLLLRPDVWHPWRGVLLAIGTLLFRWELRRAVGLGGALRLADAQSVFHFRYGAFRVGVGVAAPIHV